MNATENRHPAETYVSNAPLFHKIRLRFLGYKHMPDDHVCVIYEGESYAGVRGPGYFRINGWHERLGEVVKVSARTTPFTYENLSTREPVPVSLTGKITFSFDPRPPTEKEMAMAFVRLSADALNGFVQDAVRRLVRLYTPQYTFAALRSSVPFPEIEAAVVQDFAREELLRRMGLKLGRFTIEQSLTPERTEARLQEAAQRMYNADAVQQIPLNELLLALYTELVEKSKGGSEQIWNMNDLATLIQRLEKSAAPPTRIIDVAPPPPTIPDSDKTASGSGTTASDPGTTTPDAGKTAPDSDDPPKRSSSYLDPDL
ncbi:hypothetical protein FBQ82_06995 [Anaerolineae bacterium CFX7]|nr:hypothetical protein [Anaerolineae bacterium CFX7]